VIISFVIFVLATLLRAIYNRRKAARNPRSTMVWLTCSKKGNPANCFHRGRRSRPKRRMRVNQKNEEQRTCCTPPLSHPYVRQPAKGSSLFQKNHYLATCEQRTTRALPPTSIHLTHAHKATLRWRQCGVQACARSSVAVHAQLLNVLLSFVHNMKSISSACRQ
jgi:hypothetical protein